MCTPFLEGNPHTFDKLTMEFITFIISCIQLWQFFVIGALAGIGEISPENVSGLEQNDNLGAMTITIGETRYVFEKAEQFENFDTLKALVDVSDEGGVIAIDEFTPAMVESFKMVYEYTVRNKLPDSLNDVNSWENLTELLYQANFLNHQPLMEALVLKLKDIFMEKLNFSEAIPNVSLTPVNSDTIKRHVIYRALKGPDDRLLLQWKESGNIPDPVLDFLQTELPQKYNWEHLYDDLEPLIIQGLPYKEVVMPPPHRGFAPITRNDVEILNTYNVAIVVKSLDAIYIKSEHHELLLSRLHTLNVECKLL